MGKLLGHFAKEASDDGIVKVGGKVFKPVDGAVTSSLNMAQGIDRLGCVGVDRRTACSRWCIFV